MAKEYVKLWISYDAYFEPLSAAEVGRLVLAMIEYKSRGTEPVFNGNERFVWPAIKRDIDLQSEAQDHISSIRSDSGKLGGRTKKEKQMLLDESKKNQGQGQGQGQIKKDISSEISKKSAARCSRSKNEGKPSYEELEAYCKEQGVNAEEVWDYYESNGWRVGKNPMKDWKAVVRNWKRRQFSGTSAKKQDASEQKDYSFDLEAFEREHKWRVPDLPEGEG